MKGGSKNGSVWGKAGWKVAFWALIRPMRADESECARTVASECVLRSIASATSRASSDSETAVPPRSWRPIAASGSTPTPPRAASSACSLNEILHSSATPPRWPLDTWHPVSVLRKRSFPACDSHCYGEEAGPPGSRERAGFGSSGSVSRRFVRDETAVL